MFTWSDLVKYVRANYKIAKEAPDILGLVFETGTNRSQVVLLTRHVLMGGKEEWLQISSPIGEFASIDMRAILTEVGEMVCGGLAIDGDILVIRDAIPLANLDVNEFERPLLLVTTTADRLEHKYVGGDEF